MFSQKRHRRNRHGSPRTHSAQSRRPTQDRSHPTDGKSDYAYGNWQTNWTLRRVAATAVFAAAALASAYGATLSLDQVLRTERHLVAEAGELQLLAEYAAFMANETAAIRRTQQSPGIDNLRSALGGGFASTALNDEDPVGKMVAFNLGELKIARDSAAERRCLAEAIYFEARSERRVGQMAVADVVLNRVKSSVYPNTICDVVYQGSERVTGCQFSFTCDGSMNGARLSDRNKRWADAQDMAGAILAGLRKPVSREATHYHADYVDPPWAATLAPTATIGTHKFYRFNNRSVDFAAPAGM